MKTNKLRIGRKRKKVYFILIFALLLLFICFTGCIGNAQTETEKKPLYFQLTMEQSDEIPYFFESDRTIVQIEKNRIICYGIIRAMKKGDTLNDPKDYKWKEEDYFSISLKYDARFIERYFSQPIEKNGQGHYESLRMDLKSIDPKPYIISNLSKSKEFPYYLDESRVLNKEKILIKDLVSYFNKKYEEYEEGKYSKHKIFPIQYKVIFTLEYTSFSSEKKLTESILIPPISKGDHIYLWVTNKVILEGVKTSEDLLIDEIQPEPPERFSRHVLYRTEPENIHIVIGEPSSPWEELNLWAQSNLGIIVLILGPVSIFLTALSLWINLKNRNDKNPIMEHENMHVKKISITISISAISLVFIRLIWPDLNIDWITVALIVIAIIPWMAPILKRLEMPGGLKIEFKDVKDASEKIIAGREVKSIETKNFADLKPIIENEPGLSLVYLRIEIEKRIRKLAGKHDVETKRYTTLRHLLRELHNRDIIPSNIYSGLEELAILGNKAVHGAKVSNNASNWALDSGPKILRVLDDILNKKEN